MIIWGCLRFDVELGVRVIEGKKESKKKKKEEED